MPANDPDQAVCIMSLVRGRFSTAVYHRHPPDAGHEADEVRTYLPPHYDGRWRPVNDALPTNREEAVQQMLVAAEHLAEGVIGFIAVPISVAREFGYTNFAEPDPLPPPENGLRTIGD